MTPATIAHTRAAALTAVDRGISLVARISRERVWCFSDGATGKPLRRYWSLIEREARVRRLVREAVERAFGSPDRFDRVPGVDFCGVCGEGIAVASEAYPDMCERCHTEGRYQRAERIADARREAV